ncbi:hypothetical protein EYV94_11480 [Puteibacter caeruleilacunae]|nr:hypothetical protein EYV94_11480 [Puteibacter caeruleilacunae]
MKGLTTPRGSIFRWISLIVFSINVICCNQTEKCSSELTCAQLDSIESVMFKYPNLIDSLLQQVDTTDITPHERARIKTYKGHYLNNIGDFDESILILIEAEDFFVEKNNDYYLYLNRLIRAFSFEQLKLFSEAAGLFTQCDKYFTEHNYKALNFYSSLGLLRLNEFLGLNKNDQERKFNKIVSELNDEYYDALMYASLGNISNSDSVKMVNFGRARAIYKKSKRWSEVYGMDCNMLDTKYRMNNWQEIEGGDIKLSPTDYVYSPTLYQELRNMYFKAFVLERQRRNEEALEAAQNVLAHAQKMNAIEEEKQSLKLLAILYNRIGDDEQAYQVERQYVAAKDRQEEILNKSQLVALSANYRFSQLKKEALDSKLKTRSFQFILLTLFFVFCAVFFGGWNLVRRKEDERKKEAQTNVRIEKNLTKVNEALNEKKVEKKDLVTKIKLEQLKSEDSDKIKLLLSDISNDHISSWVVYETRFYELFPDWVEKLKQKYPNLTVGEIKYCMCFYFNLKNVVISKLTGNAINSVKSGKTRVRRKLGLKTIEEVYLELKRIK